ncbi:hypothetical protein HBI81_127090 [Parastagonospora nodorum]|nr:hypothetical protein HBH51_118160 [Parastagonospora nodorum]KAH3988734.1 hypothetical protein HBH52_026860 [Parastagonospora nodorum]KAH4848095.1 hypothetical protein HBH75_158320 [Parastagonospora nodorum]KAH5495758.1 hypothetical protein HBI31_104020 [Parastagonospora nodorum]KAH6031157.1 hypothetical protein HBI82_043430 [Parastagonospora nodorum]
MPSARNVESFLLSVLGEFEWHIREAGCWDSVNVQPTLTNAVLPMFQHRWATGPNQYTSDVCSGLYPGLVLALRFLSEDWPLLWFTKLTFARRCPSTTKPGSTYLAATSSQTPAAEIAKVKANLAELGEVVTLMFAPRSCNEKAWGVTYNTKRAMRFHTEVSDTDRPRIKPEYSTDTISSCTPAETYRVHFLFAITLVHEITHAYWFWFNEKTPEPVWHEGERNAELGFSLEREVIGHVVQPMLGYQGIEGIRTLISSELREYANSKDRMDAVIELQDATKLSKTLTRYGAKRKWPVLKTSDLRGSELFLENSSQKYLGGIKCINMAWVSAWFQEDEWVRRRRDWDRRNMYWPPAVRDAFLVVYDQNGTTVQILRSLNVTSEGDAKIHKELQKEEKELTARKKQREKDKEDFRKAFVEMKL